MSVEEYKFALGVSGTVITILLGVIAFFVARVVSDVKSNNTEIGKNKGRIELVEQQQINDMKLLQETTQLEIRAMSKEVGELSKNVNTLVTALAEQAIKK